MLPVFYELELARDFQGFPFQLRRFYLSHQDTGTPLSLSSFNDVETSNKNLHSSQFYSFCVMFKNQVTAGGTR